jgi:hypothetical protein
MSVTYYDYEAEMSDFADDLAGAIIQAGIQYPTFSWDHRRYDDSNIAIVHEQRGAGTDWEHIAYGYYLKYTSPQNSCVRFWIGKIIYPPAHPPPNVVIGIWADGYWSRIIPHIIHWPGGTIQARPLSCPEHFWDLPAGTIPPYDDPQPSQWGAYNRQNRNAQGNFQAVLSFLNTFLAAIP